MSLLDCQSEAEYDELIELLISKHLITGKQLNNFLLTASQNMNLRQCRLGLYTKNLLLLRQV